MRVPGLTSWAVREPGASKTARRVRPRLRVRVLFEVEGCGAGAGADRVLGSAHSGLAEAHGGISACFIFLARRQRHVASTALNERSAAQHEASFLYSGVARSSRSHCVLSLCVRGGLEGGGDRN